ncbi:acyl carrier protein [Streptomyces sp. F63]|uniref:phosphopantetheine-binding protein n=1 Tax=Streptomyces sp. F63 TaxID=2824887 RepID=UPI001B398A02|nr:phosphopantetheine-binding protein [Streptomyces sp. F63]MBQ0983214.1 acyl carrier protein [Streptomyces sp. F63]
MSATILDRVIELLEQRDSVTETVTPEIGLADLGVDSIDLVYLLTSFERTDDAEFEDTDFDLGRYGTVSDLAGTIATRIHD